MLKVVLTSFFIIILAERLLLGQLIFCTNALFGTQNFTTNVA